MSGLSGAVILSRLVDDDGQAVVIEVGKPTPAEAGAECVFRVDEQGFHSHGTDELAALYAAVTEIGAILARANRKAGRARFAVAAELGFPDPTPTGAEADPTDGPDSGVGEIIARRVFDHDGRRHSITVGRPFHAPDSGLTLCPFQVDDRPRAVAGGWDGMQALLTALGMIGAWLGLPRDWAATTPG
ncbi:hypothetical protein IU451_29805 [Nocardia cyriacigeorgica]|uniref:DUF6968 family protein n=1 Tax=Nocardia cyriacigeorgica TaxID=135487 RepID=UPI001893E757|nr:hypothetical protein [Nocardia cyriacigeorgica]MBF6326696.1 hypothetical protein [Nocardia cyriacigeorgica]